MRRVVLLTLAIAGLVALLALISPFGGRLPRPYATPSADNSPHVTPAPSTQRLQVPPGFSVNAWAEGFMKPRFMLQAPGGEVLVADSGYDAERESAGPPRTSGRDGAVYVIASESQAGAGLRDTLIANLDRPYGLALWNGYLYVAESQSIKRYRYDARTRRAGAGEEVISLAGFGDGHWTRSLLFDRAGRSLFVGVGSASNVNSGENERRAAINRYNPDGTGHQIFASGTRNPIGLHWYPGTDTLWATVQERDGLGDDLPPDYLTHVEPGGFYGWPYAYIGAHPDPRLKGQRPDLVEETETPDVLLGAHVGALDFTFYTGRQFPDEYRGGAFVALHGSWNREQRTGYSVVFVPFRNGQPSGKPKDFLTGWMLSPSSREVWGRPVAVLELADGSLLVSDDGGRKIWRVSYDGKDARREISATGCLLRTQQSPTSGTAAGAANSKFVLTQAVSSDKSNRTYPLDVQDSVAAAHVGQTVRIAGRLNDASLLEVNAIDAIGPACK